MNWAVKKLSGIFTCGETADRDGPGALDEYLASYHDSPQVPKTIRLTDLEASHSGFGSSLHQQAGEREIDVAAFIYSIQRLPDCLEKVERVVLYSREETLAAAGYPDFETWSRVSARARRRRTHFDGYSTLALFVTSVSDLDDLLPVLCAAQIEWNKMHARLADSDLGPVLASGRSKASDVGETIRRTLGLSALDWDLLRRTWADSWDDKLAALAYGPKDIEVQRLPLDRRDFQSAASEWWDKAIDFFSEMSLIDRPVYLVSSNTHGLANLLTGFTGQSAEKILEFVLDHNPENFRHLWQKARRESALTRENLLYYARRLYLEHNPEEALEAQKREDEIGFRRYTPQHYPHLQIQVFPLSGLRYESLDPFLGLPKDHNPPATEAVLINIDYPLGFTAYYLLEQALRRFPELIGVYVLGKSAAMIGRLGDIMIPGQIHDMHSGGVYRFRNVFTARHLVPYLDQMAAFDDQKSITVRGTFLHGWETVRQLHHFDFTGLEMEAGPYLSALFRHFHGRAPAGESEASLKLPPGFDFGLLHYTSDTPYNVRASLLSHSLGVTGLEAAYGCTRAILRRIIRHVETRPNNLPS